MNDEENKIIEKIEKLIALSGSDNENEAKAAMLKAQELMAKYEIEQDRIDPERKKERPVVCFTSPMFRDDWCVDVGSLIANNFRCRAIISQRRNSGGAYRPEILRLRRRRGNQYQRFQLCRKGDPKERRRFARYTATRNANSEEMKRWLMSMDSVPGFTGILKNRKKTK